MQRRNIHDAKSQLSHLIELACAGEEVIICKAGKPRVKLVPYQKKAGKRKPGCWRGKIKIARDFDEISPDIETLFQGDFS